VRKNVLFSVVVLEELGILAVGHANSKVRGVLEVREVAVASVCVVLQQELFVQRGGARGNLESWRLDMQTARCAECWKCTCVTFGP
jgi:hypothetical protein